MRTSTGYMRMDGHYRLRRRRLLGLAVFGAIILASLAINDWRISPIWNVFGPSLLAFDEGTWVDGDPYGEWVYTVCDGEHERVAVYGSGGLAGASGLDSLQTMRHRGRCDLPKADLADLDAWRAQLDELESLARSPTASARQMLDVAGAMPVSYLYLKPIRDWVRADAAHAVDLLDALAAKPMRFHHPNAAIARARETAFAGVVDEALARVVSDGVGADRVDVWLAADQIAGRRQNASLLKRVAAMEGLSDAAAAQALGRLESVPGHERAELYAALAAKLVDNPDYASVLVRQLRLVPHHERSRVVQPLLTRPDSTPQFAVALLGDFDRQFHQPDAQLDAFMAIGDKLKQDAGAPLMLSAHLRDIPGVQRRMAATYLLGLDPAGETAFALGVLGAFDDLHPLSRPKVVYALLNSEQFTDRRVQEACLLAIQLETRGDDRQELLTALLNHRDLDSELQTRIRSDAI